MTNQFIKYIFFLLFVIQSVYVHSQNNNTKKVTSSSTNSISSSQSELIDIAATSVSTNFNSSVLASFIEVITDTNILAKFVIVPLNLNPAVDNPDKKAKKQNPTKTNQPSNSSRKK